MNEKEKFNQTTEENLKTEKITARSLAEELLPLINDYFIGDFIAEGDGIICRFLNGQRFKITIGQL